MSEWGGWGDRREGKWGGPTEIGRTRRIEVVPVWGRVGPVTRFRSKLDPLRSFLDPS